MNLPPPAQWTLPGLEFTALWFALGRDRLPYPISIDQDRADTADEAFEVRCAAVRSVTPKIDDDLSIAMLILDEPELRIESHGFAGTGELRLYAGVRERAAALVVQDPKLEQVTLTLCAPAELPRRIAGTLPEASAGTRGDIRVMRSDLDAQDDEPAFQGLHEQRHSTTAERVQAMFGRRRSGWGEITLFAGPSYDNRPTDDGKSFFWMDFENDGRYFVTTGNVIQARPMDSAKTVETLQTWITQFRELQAAR